ncbi:unnamed protein product [Gemmata massiliana]|uniref:Uncharacterized protein n=1 Tax=Gemmata massiliana TaxID=1210884 RepID=A0A6P2CWM3_9BACT|nr:hypothetical protein [Gemmata massiliana]VTR93391.1 unnamed protein product [Gemmata massiliana]
MKRVVFRSLGLLVGVLFLFGTGLMVRDERYKDAVLTGGLGLLFTAYGALGEYKIRGLLGLIGAKDGSSQRSGRGKFGE